MGIEHRQWDPETDDRTMESRGRESSVRARAGRTLRHWTTDLIASVGKATTRASGAGDWGLAESRQRNLIVSKLKSVASEGGST